MKYLALPPALLLVAAVAAVAAAADRPAFTPGQVAFYQAEVKPLLQKHCFKCHGPGEKVKGGLRLSTRAAVLQGGDTGPAVDLAKPAESLMLLAVHNKRPEGADVMPPAGKLSDKDLAILAKWVNDGLPVSADDLGRLEEAPKHAAPVDDGKSYWAYQPVKRPAAPEVKDKSWVKSPVDAFILAKLEAKGLKPNGPAGKVALVRRAYYDLLGLPPTPEQVDEFARDESPDAFEKLVDQLLASPHYGEKWGRHWLDVVRYAETNGYERDGPKPYAWKYRDYVIRSFNADKPYDQFLREQVAGDELPGYRPEAVIATGFYRLGLWDDEPADAKQALFDGYDDLVSVVGQGVLGMTVNCARCHDHKKDPIPQADYYRLVAFFRDVRPFSDTRGVRSSNNIADVTPPERKKLYEGELAERQKQVRAIEAEMKPIEDAAIKKMPPEDQLKVDDGKRAEVLGKVPTFLDRADRRKYQALKGRLDALRRQPLPSQELVLAVANCDPTPPATHVLARGNPHAPKDEVKPGFPKALGGADAAVPTRPPGAKSSGRRTALADWLASPANPLTARVMVNRIWQHHFGRGIVPSPNDFGKLGEPPTHPELLDWLADEFVRGGWTVKRLHKLLMLSNVYRMSAAADPAALKADPANALFWRFNMRRLSAEEVRDSVLSVSGKLDLTRHGPSVYPKIPDAVLAGQSKPGDGWEAGKGGGYDPAKPEAGNRRSVYVHVKRSLQVPVLAAHDQADTDSSCPVRYTTTVPTQALGLLNGEFSTEQAAALAKRLAREHPGDVPAQVRRAVRLTTGRVPGDDEVAKDAAFVRAMKADHGLDDATALARYALLALNANEFVYLD